MCTSVEDITEPGSDGGVPMEGTGREERGAEKNEEPRRPRYRTSAASGRPRYRRRRNAMYSTAYPESSRGL